jgi:glycosyltransferase involved in cell wall biosynthesis
MKKILVLDTGKEWGGGTNSLLELVKRVDKNRYSFSAIFLYNYGRNDGVTIGDTLSSLGVEFIYMPIRRQGLGIKSMKECSRAILFYSKTLKRRAVFWIDFYTRINRTAKKIIDVVRKNEYSLLYMNNQPSSNLEGLLAAHLGTALTKGGFSIPIVQHARSNARLLPEEVRLANMYLARMICVSEGLKDSYVKQNIRGDIVRVVYNGIDVTIKPSTPPSQIRQELGIRDAEVLIGMVGSLMKRKGFDLFISSLKRLKESGKGFKGLIIGTGPEVKRLRQFSERLDLADDIIFAGFKNDAISYINALDILVLSSHGEGFPRSILEAMLMAKPVVATNVTGSAELVIDGETGYLVPTNPEKLSQALLRLMDDRGLRELMGEKGRKRVIENFSIEKYIAGVEELFSEVLAG